jgi:hypothetical protein
MKVRLFNDAVSTVGIVYSRMRREYDREWWLYKDFGGYDRGLFHSTILAFAWRD